MISCRGNQYFRRRAPTSVRNTEQHLPSIVYLDGNFLNKYSFSRYHRDSIFHIQSLNSCFVLFFLLLIITSISSQGNSVLMSLHDTSTFIESSWSQSRLQITSHFLCSFVPLMHKSNPHSPFLWSSPDCWGNGKHLTLSEESRTNNWSKFIAKLDVILYILIIHICKT